MLFIDDFFLNYVYDSFEIIAFFLFMCTRSYRFYQTGSLKWAVHDTRQRNAFHLEVISLQGFIFLSFNSVVIVRICFCIPYYPLQSDVCIMFPVYNAVIISFCVLRAYSCFVLSVVVSELVIGFFFLTSCKGSA